VLQTLLQISSSSATIEEIYLPFISLDSNPLRFIAENFPKLKRLLFFLQDTKAIPSEDGEEVEDDWETVGGPSETDSDDEIIDVGEDDEHDSMNSTGWMPFNEFRKLLNMSGQDLEEMMFKPQDGDEPLLDDYDDNGSECSDTSASVDWPEDEVAVSQKVYEDLKPDSFEVRSIFQSPYGAASLRCARISCWPWQTTQSLYPVIYECSASASFRCRFRGPATRNPCQMLISPLWLKSWELVIQV
jgi:hypothetical protein